MNRSRTNRRHAGFTLIEIMAVVVIMGMLIGIVGTVVFNRIDQARTSTAVLSAPAASLL